MTDIKEASQIITFDGQFIKGTVDMTKATMVCIPSKPHYKIVELAIKESCGNVVIAEVGNASLSFSESIKLGNELEKRWNAKPSPKGAHLPIEDHPNFQAFIRTFWKEAAPYLKDLDTEHKGILPQTLPEPIITAMANAGRLLQESLKGLPEDIVGIK
ncbi:hypothetical protein AB6D11_00105 [Vibrio splendidus]